MKLIILPNGTLMFVVDDPDQAAQLGEVLVEARELIPDLPRGLVVNGPLDIVDLRLTTESTP